MRMEATADEMIAALRSKAIDRFSRWAIEGAQHALTESQNPLRLNFFSTAMRILFEHVMDTLAPEDQVVRASWFRRRGPMANRHDGNARSLLFRAASQRPS